MLLLLHGFDTPLLVSGAVEVAGLVVVQHVQQLRRDIASVWQEWCPILT